MLVINNSLLLNAMKRGIKIEIAVGMANKRWRFKFKQFWLKSNHICADQVEDNLAPIID